MRYTFSILAVAAVLVVNGYIAFAHDDEAGPIADAVGPSVAAAESEAEPQIIEWQGHTTAGGIVDLLTHSVYTETAMFPVHQSGFLLEIHEEPQAIEVRVDWDDPLVGSGSYQLHPHYIVDKTGDLTGDTEYYGYRSDNFDESGGCIRIPDTDMYAGVWPMMVHALSTTAIETDFTITVAVLGATATVLDAMHGHRLGGNSMDDHGVEECQLLADPA